MFKSRNISRFCLRKKRYDKRIIIIGILFILIFAGLAGRCYYCIIIKGEERRVMADNQYFYEERISDKNYRIFDRTGKDLLEYDIEYYAIVDPWTFMKFNMDKNSSLIREVKYILGEYNSQYDLDKIKYKDISNKVTYKIDQITYNKLEGVKNINNIKGFYIYYRSCVKDKDAWNIVNMLSNEIDSGTGELKDEDSLEMKIWNTAKENKFPVVRYEKDNNGNIFNKEMITENKNLNVRLTLDKNVQDNIKEILCSDKYKKYDQIGAVLIEAKTGKIRGMVQKDDTLPNVNLGIASNHGFFPGSIFKVIVEEAALEKNRNSLYEEYKHIDEYTGEEEYVSLKNALARSLNDIFGKIGVDIGFEGMYEYSKAQGLLSPVLNIHGEQGGNFEIDEKNITLDQIKHAAIGQKMRITPVEALSIPNTVINEGIYVKPHIVEAVVDDSNMEIDNNLFKKEPRSRIIKQSTAKVLKNHMLEVVNSGSARGVKLDNVEIGGKTGTTEYYELDPNNERKEHSDGWFTGFFKLGGKYYSMVVLVRDIDLDQEAASTAVPIFKEIVEKLRFEKYLYP